jgi:hypothetical protein
VSFESFSFVLQIRVGLVEGNGWQDINSTTHGIVPFLFGFHTISVFSFHWSCACAAEKKES